MDVEKNGTLTERLLQLTELITTTTQEIIRIRNILENNLVKTASNDLSDSKKQKIPVSRSKRINDFMLELNIPTSQLGYSYIRNSLEIILSQLDKNPQFRVQVTKWLYPLVAENFQSTPSRIERTMRHSIHCAAKKHSTLYAKLFSDTTPTNSEFFNILLNYLEV